MAKGSAHNASANKTLRTTCANCGKSIPTQIDPSVATRETWGLLVKDNGKPVVVPVCRDCYLDGWRPTGYVDVGGG